MGKQRTVARTTARKAIGSTTCAAARPRATASTASAAAVSLATRAGVQLAAEGASPALPRSPVIPPICVRSLAAAPPEATRLTGLVGFFEHRRAEALGQLSRGLTGVIGNVVARAVREEELGDLRAAGGGEH